MQSWVICYWYGTVQATREQVPSLLKGRVIQGKYTKEQQSWGADFKTGIVQTQGLLVTLELVLRDTESVCVCVLVRAHTHMCRCSTPLAELL